MSNTEAAQTIESMNKGEALLKERNATLSISHDRSLVHRLNKPPAFYR
ncbi:MAG: hypothetical protein JJ934_15405 [Pseudomonadales bacterium]|nr:hypothetical protein [Pseudomonadales bacterium]MBO6658282.1 hypothetical protein [Pseudomonadales bacterium]